MAPVSEPFGKTRSSDQLRSNHAANTPREVNLNVVTYREVNMAKITYSVLTYSATRRGALVDRGANGGIAGEDVRIIAKTGRQVDIQGIDNHCISDIPIVTAGGVVTTQKGEVIAIMHQYAYVGKGKTIHSCGQLEAHKQDVHDKSIKVGGKQRIETLDGYIIPLNIRQGLPFMTIRPYTDAEWEQLPHVILTADTDWDPSILDCEQEDNEEWFNAMEELPTLRALYGLRSSGARWHDKLADVLQNEGFTPCKAEPDIWMRRNGELYEYIAVYVDDLAFAMKNPSHFIDTLKTKYGFKIREAGPLNFTLVQISS